MDLNGCFFDFYNPDFHPLIYEQRSNAGDAKAMRDLAYYYGSLCFSSPSREATEKFYYFGSKLCESSDIETLFSIIGYSSDYDKENNIKLNNRIYELCSKRLIADRSVENLCNMAQCYLHEIGIDNKVSSFDNEEDDLFSSLEETAYKLLEEAAELGSAEAMYLLSCYYRQKSKEPSFWESESVQKKYNAKIAKENLLKYKELLIQSADLGYAEAICSLAYEYTNGIHFPKDENKAIQYYSQAADLNYVSAMILIVEFYVKHNKFEEALKYLKNWHYGIL